jgi:hypothetical protein
LSLDPIDTVGYEQRIVCFFDILGWKEHVEKAGKDPHKIEQLAFLPKLLTSIEVRGLNSSSSHLTSFSDCAVVSFLVSEVNIRTFIGGLSQVFLGAAVQGFFLRAGLTIGSIRHNENMVFGPALNRAYELESSGGFPRIIIDNEVSNLADLDFVKEEGGTLFVDPFEYALLNQVASRDDTLASLSRTEFMLDQEIRSLPEPVEVKKRPKSPSPREKLEWLHLRVRRLVQRVLNQQI